MAISTVTARFGQDVRTVWRAVTDVENCSWRSDLEGCALNGEGRFTERAKGGCETRFAVTYREEYRRWEFKMENSRMSGRWTGVFSRFGSGTEAVFTEDVRAKNALLRPFVGMYLKRQQARYVRDLEAYLEGCR